MAGDFTNGVCTLLTSVPSGCVVTYGRLAKAAGSPQAARQVVRILHSQSQSRNLPWHRVVASGGRIVIRDSQIAQLQRELLLAEGVEFEHDGCVDLNKYGWNF